MNGAFRNVKHPTLGTSVARTDAWALVTLVPPEEQEAIDAERSRRGLPLGNPDPVTQADIDRYNAMLDRMENE